MPRWPWVVLLLLLLLLAPTACDALIQLARYLTSRLPQVDMDELRALIADGAFG